MLPASALTNVNGILEFGRHTYNPQAAGVTLTLQAGERIANTVESSPDRATARIDFGGHVLENDGGEIDMRWCYAYTGAFRQRAGRASFFYDFVAGIRPEDTAAVNVRPFAFLIEGGTLSARRMEVGCAADWSRPTRAVFAGGTTLLNSATAYAGIALALANGPAVDTKKVYGNPDARIEVTGDAVVKARGIWLGTYPDTGAATAHSSVTNGYGEILLTGGSLYVGTAGIRPAPARWAETADGTNTWTTLRMAGGRLGSDTGTDSSCNVYLPMTFDGTDNVIACENADGAGLDMHLRGPLLGDGGFTKTGSGALRVYGPHVATGKVTVANGTLMYYNPAAEAEVVRTEVEVPAATFGWTADSLAGDAGTAVDSWAPTNKSATGSNTFAVSPLASLGITAPKISAETMNGHRTLAFDAAACTGIGMGGVNARSLLGSPTSMTWMFVFRTPTNAPAFNNDGNVGPLLPHVLLAEDRRPAAHGRQRGPRHPECEGRRRAVRDGLGSAARHALQRRACLLLHLERLRRFVHGDDGRLYAEQHLAEQPGEFHRLRSHDRHVRPLHARQPDHTARQPLHGRDRGNPLLQKRGPHRRPARADRARARRTLRRADLRLPDGRGEGERRRTRRARIRDPEDGHRHRRTQGR